MDKQEIKHKALEIVSALGDGSLLEAVTVLTAAMVATTIISVDGRTLLARAINILIQELGEHMADEEAFIILMPEGLVAEKLHPSMSVSSHETRH